MFILLYDIKVIGLTQKLVTHISRISFEIYLFTYVTDNLIWNKFNEGNYFGNIKAVNIIAATISSFTVAVFFAEILCGVKKFSSNKKIYMDR